ncbi:MAG: histidine kinase [Salinivirgaceae bacterium]|jgi:two-component system LytT family sensor kinase|nr:histidine kinase [Salinivirgaceae bacterium]
MLNPRLYKTSLTVISLIWTAFVAVHTFFMVYFLDLTPANAFRDALVFNILFAILAAGILLALQFDDNRKSIDRRIIYFYLPMFLLIITIWLAGSYSILLFLIQDDQYHIFLNLSMKYRALIGVFLFSMVFIVHQLIHYYQNYQQKQLKATRLESELQRSKVNTLQMQMQPHFLFNALNSISSLTFDDSEKTRQMLIKLSDFLRYTTRYSEQQLVKLSDELSHIDQYLAIEHLRFGDRLVYQKKVAPDANERFLPCLVLQPLFENAVKHGVNQSINPVTISINAFVKYDKLVVVVSNTKDGESSKKGTRTGLKNLNNRLKLLYSDRADLRIENAPELFTVTLTIP